MAVGIEPYRALKSSMKSLDSVLRARERMVEGF